MYTEEVTNFLKQKEVHHAKEGIILTFCVIRQEIWQIENGWVKVKCVRMELGEPQLHPEEKTPGRDSGFQFEMELDTVIMSGTSPNPLILHHHRS